MDSVTFSTHCHAPHLSKLHAPGVLDEIVRSHAYPFAEVQVVHQRCQGLQYTPLFDPWGRGVRIAESESCPHILSDYGLPEDDPTADDTTHGPGAAHYWKWHVINHLIGLTICRTDWIVFADCDTLILKSPPDRSWIEEGIDILSHHPEVLLVGPSDGGSMREAVILEPDILGGGKPVVRARLTRNVSQQLFLVNVQRFRKVDFNIPWNWEKLAPGGPCQEFYYMAEGRIWRYLDKYGLWRAILPEKWRYFHFNPWDPPECYHQDFSKYGIPGDWR